LSIRKGNIIIAGSAGATGTGGGIANADNTTIITNPDGSISTIAIKDQNNIENVKFWTGTLDEYEALQEYDDTIIYTILDDEGTSTLVDGQTIKNINNKLVVTTATNDLFGIVKPDNETIKISDGVISANVPEVDLSEVALKSEIFSGSYNDLTDKPEAYVLPTASTTTLGGVKVDGETITILNGIISAASAGGGEWDIVTRDNNWYMNHSISGLTLQGGYLSGSTGGGGLTVSFSTPFNTKCVTCITDGYYTYTIGNTSRSSTSSSSITTSSFYVSMVNSVTCNYQFNWFAIGY
jgi:hypothetical protein